MKTTTTLAIFVLGLATLAGVCFVGVKFTPADQPHFGSAVNNILPAYPTQTKVWVGTSDTLVVATSSGRVLLDIGNASGATTTAQALYCSFGDVPSTVYSGLMIQASSSKSFTLDNMYRGAIRCRFPIAASTVTVTDF